MKTAVIGTGYVGLVTGTCLADLGRNIVCIDNNREKINKLKSGVSPFYEPGLTEKLIKNTEKNRLELKTSIQDGFNSCHIFFIAVGTPPDSEGRADLTAVFSVVDEIIGCMKQSNDKKRRIIVTKSTVPVGTGQKIIQKITKHNLLDRIGVVSNPEFLREGSALYDFFHPDRIVIGGQNQEDIEEVSELYDPLFRQDTPVIKTTLETAELSKYASNAFLATKISFINEMANLCEKAGADIKTIANIMGKDGRIGKYFLHPGPGYGGSCFPKDTEALINIADELNYDFKIIKSVKQVNDTQHTRAIERLKLFFPDGLTQKRVAILGLAFKPNTDDIRESSALKIIKELLKEGVKITVFDPEAMENTKKEYAGTIEYGKDVYETVQEADCVMLITEWNVFKELDLNRIKTEMKGKIFIDLRGVYHQKQLEKEGFDYYIIGQKKLEKTTVF